MTLETETCIIKSNGFEHQNKSKKILQWYLIKREIFLVRCKTTNSQSVIYSLIYNSKSILLAKTSYMFEMNLD